MSVRFRYGADVEDKPVRTARLLTVSELLMISTDKLNRSGGMRQAKNPRRWRTAVAVLPLLVFVGLVDVARPALASGPSAQETLVAQFADGPEAVTTANSYSGLVTISVSGFGQASATECSDAFYIYAVASGVAGVCGDPAPPRHIGDFGLCINSQTVDNYTTAPDYSADHVYRFTISLSGSQNLTFGVCDTFTSDNTGSFTVTIGASVPVLVAFGDSIAAGQGSGNADHYPDNPGAYPARLAAKLGWDSQNFAITGACAATTGAGTGAPANCKRSILRDELPLAASMGLHPDLVTVTIGANDIDFRDCLMAAVGLQKSNPCDTGGLAKSLAAYKRNLTKAVAGIKKLYPNVPVAITQYFDPLPIAHGCALMAPLYLYKTIVLDNHLLAVIKQLLLYQGDLTSAVDSYQDSLTIQALTIINKLNAAIQSVATAEGITTVPLDVTGHDLCKDYPDSGTTGWVLGPQATAAFSYHNTLINASWESDFFPVHRCQPLPACDVAPQINIVRGGTNLGTTVSFSLTFATNDLPHLTSDGNDAIADQIKTRLSL